LGLLLRAGAIVEIPPPLRYGAIVASASLGRWLVLPVMAWLPAVRDRPSLASDVGRRVGVREVVVGAFLAVPGVVPLAWLSPGRFLVAILVLMIALGWIINTIERRIGGVTGDCLGFTCYVGQVLVLLVAAARIDWPG
jgi:adenosylcobinamide-GDP ribazoletransferase